MLNRNIRTLPPLATLGLVGLALMTTVMVAGAACQTHAASTSTRTLMQQGAQANTSHRMTIEPQQWMTGEPASPAKGVSIETMSTHGQPNQKDRPIRMLLMEFPNDDAQAKLEYRIVNDAVRNVSTLGVDLIHGAALIELGQADSSMVDLLSDFIVAGRQHRARQPHEAGLASLNLIGGEELVESQWMVLDRLIEDKVQEQERERVEELARQMVFNFWRLIVTYSVVAGAQGTNLLLLALPNEDGTTDILFRNIKGDKGIDLEIPFEKQKTQTLATGQSYGLRVQAHGPIVCLQLEEAHEEKLQQAFKALATGWNAAFGVSYTHPYGEDIVIDCPPQDPVQP